MNLLFYFSLTYSDTAGTHTSDELCDGEYRPYLSERGIRVQEEKGYCVTVCIYTVCMCVCVWCRVGG